MVLIAITQPRSIGTASTLRRAYIVLRYRIAGSLRRLETRRLVEPGWDIRLGRRPTVKASPTPDGRRVARAAAVVLELEEFGGRLGGLTST